MSTKSSKEKLIHLNTKQTNYKYRRKIYKKKILLKDGTEKIDEFVLIILSQLKDNSSREVIHPITKFILQPSFNRGLPKVSTQLAKANVIVSFFNYVFIDNLNKFSITNICELHFYHAQSYLNSYRYAGVSINTVKAKERVLTNLYYYLAQNNVLDNIYLNDFESQLYYYNDNKQKIFTKSPFSYIYYPEETESNIMHNLPNDLILLFLDTALIYTPRIALGVYCQFFGGLRVGEVTNMTIYSIKTKGPFCKYGLIVNLRNRRLRNDLKNATSGGAVKKIRRQAVYPYRWDILTKIYKNHIENYVIPDKSGALFWGKNKKPMTDVTYRYYFEKLKKKFIQRLKDSDDIKLKNYSIELQSKKWSTHIGRGVFSNMVAEVAKNISQIRQARGDSTFEASMTYLSDSSKMAQLLLENQLDMWEMLLEDIETLEQNKY